LPENKSDFQIEPAVYATPPRFYMDNETEIARGILARGRELGKQRGLLKFARVKDAHAEIARLEILLGVSPGRLPLNIFTANARVFELTELLARTAAPPTPPPSPVPAVTQSAPAPALRGLARAAAATKIHGPKNKSGRSDLHGRERMKSAIQLEGRKS
jgi:hypothetical protein